MSSWISVKTNKRIFKSAITNNNDVLPTFHILIATGGRSSLKRMLDSLKNQLFGNDAITIIFDGDEALKSSTFCSEWLVDHKAKINIIEQKPNLGFWGHEIRNTYQTNLEPKTTFIMHADDDDIYADDAFHNLRANCYNPNTLYIAKFLNKKINKIIPSQNFKIDKDDIGTPCGIIPFNLAGKSKWTVNYGGDFDYYNNLKPFCKEIQFLNFVIYYVL